ncbi:MAG: hypothetical protein AB1730_26790 [Myxococcota bacterium]
MAKTKITLEEALALADADELQSHSQIAHLSDRDQRRVLDRMSKRLAKENRKLRKQVAVGRFLMTEVIRGAIAQILGQAEADFVASELRARTHRIVPPERAAEFTAALYELVRKFETARSRSKK